ncbi:ANTAR domain-containing protein [Streptomyces sp. NPDC058145]|uniref:ANTAR domain-containing protein n=1 Tax=Streptomyces sp. NPDC058145 TaxID=3346356 RepID=UPI0036EECA37
MKSPFEAGLDLVIGHPRRGADGPPEVIGGLLERIGQLEQAVISHAVIDQAVGVVIALEGVRSEQAFAMLKEVSQTTNVKLRTVAEHGRASCAHTVSMALVRGSGPW